MKSDNFTRHYIIRHLSAHELGLPPLTAVIMTVNLPHMVETSAADRGGGGEQQGQFAPGPQFKGAPQTVLNSFKYASF